MGFLDRFKRKIEKYKKISKTEKNNQLLEEITVGRQQNMDIQNELDDKNLDEIYNDSDVIPNEIIDEIKRVNNIEYISDILIGRMEKYPKLVELLLEGNISQNILTSLNYYETMDYLPDKEEDLKFIEFFDLNEKTKKLVLLLNNIINNNSIDENYQCCLIDLTKEFEIIDFHNEIESFIPGIKINLGSEILTKTPIYSPFILYFPNSKHKIVHHNFDRFITGNIELDEDTIIQMSYDTFRFLDESIINKISKCKVVFSENNLDYKNEEDMWSDDAINYKLMKYNHLIYIIEKSSLSLEMKERLLYQIKNMYTDDIYFFDLELSNKIIPYLNNLDIEEIKKISKEFELNIEKYRTKKIEKPEFNVTFYIDDALPDFENATLIDVINLINSLPEELKITVLKEPRIIKKLDIPDNLDENQLKKFSFLLAQRLSTTTIDFINSLDFDVESFMSDSSNDYKTSFDINPIISKYGIFDYLDEEVIISIADLLGHDGMVNCGYYKGTNILYTFENFFKKNGDGYHTRALGLLEYKSGEHLIKELERRNHDTTDMSVRQIEDGKYIVSGNGLHRFTVLRFHYLLDCMKKEKSEEKLRELYKIPVKLVSKTNYKKTYCNYLIQKASPSVSYISFDCKEDIIHIYYNSEKQSQVINEEKLLYLAIQSIDMLDSASLLEIQHFYNCLDSFHEFVDKYIPNLLDKIEIESKKGVQK